MRNNNKYIKCLDWVSEEFVDVRWCHRIKDDGTPDNNDGLSLQCETKEEKDYKYTIQHQNQIRLQNKMINMK